MGGRSLLRAAASALLLLSAAAGAASRTDVTFVLARDSAAPGYFAAAVDYYTARPALGGQLVSNARSLADVREFLARSPLRGGQPWGRVRLVAHGSQWEGLRVPIFPQGELASPAALRQVLERGEFPPLDNRVLDGGSTLDIDSCGLGRRPALLRQLRRLFAGSQPLRVQASRDYVWFGRLQDAQGRLATARRELPYSARILAGAVPPPQGEEELRRQWRREHGRPGETLHFSRVPVRIDVPDVAERPPLALAALRSYGLRWNQLQWRRAGGRLQGEGMVVVAAPAALPLDGLPAAD